MSQPRHQIITHRRIVRYGPNALEFFLLQGGETASEVLHVYGAYSECPCGKCDDCLKESSIMLRLAGVVDPSMQKREFIFYGAVSRVRNASALESDTGPFDHPARFAPRVEHVMGYFDPRGRNGLRGWIEPLTLRPAELAFHLLNINSSQIKDAEPPKPNRGWIYYSCLDGVVDKVCNHLPGRVQLPDGRRIIGEACHPGDALGARLNFGRVRPSKKRVREHVGRLLLSNPESFTVMSEGRSITWRAMNY